MTAGACQALPVAEMVALAFVVLAVGHSLSKVPAFMQRRQYPHVPGPCEKCKIENLCAGQMNPEPGTPECMPVVCKAVCECRQGLPEPPKAPPIAILPPPPPVWTKDQTVKFCACVGVRMVDCSTQHCRDKIAQVMEIVQCENNTPNAAGAR